MTSMVLSYVCIYFLVTRLKYVGHCNFMHEWPFIFSWQMQGQIQMVFISS
jgi:hypothetical protein